jgi:Zn-dependent M28 family amino/carboxypeptidase
MPGRSPRWRKIARIVLSRILFYGGILIAAWWWMLRMPGSSAPGSLPPLSDGEASLASRLHRDVQALAVEIGERNIPDNPEHLDAAADYIERELQAAGYTARSQPFRAAGNACRNIEAELRGTALPDEIVVVGAHYDTVPGSPGADDNASGVAALLALARGLAHSPGSRTLRFLAFANEEPPWFWRPEMGSLVYAKQCRARHDRIVAMLSLESVGFYSDTPRSQTYPAWLGLLYSSTGNFVAFIGNVSSRPLVHRAITAFRATSALPSIGAAAPNSIPGVGWSDHWSFWQAGYPGIEVTDTALYRNPYYHTSADTPDRLDYPRMARLSVAMQKVVRALTDSP